MKNIKTLLILVLLILIAVLLFVYRGTITALISPERIKRTTINVVKNEKLSFLVTDRLVTQVVVEKTEVFPGLGRRSGYLVGTVKIYYGINLNQLNQDSIEVRPDKIIVHLPAPTVLDYSVDLPSLRFFTKETGMMKIATPFMDKEELRNELEESLYKEAVLFFKQNNMFPDASNLLLRMNSMATSIEKLTHIHVVFTFPQKFSKLDNNH